MTVPTGTTAYFACVDSKLNARWVSVVYGGESFDLDMIEELEAFCVYARARLAKSQLAGAAPASHKGHTK